MFLEDGGKVCVDGFPSSVYIDDVCCRWGLVQTRVTACERNAWR